jgi:hypothetical protein
MDYILLVVFLIFAMPGSVQYTIKIPVLYVETSKVAQRFKEPDPP